MFSNRHLSRQLAVLFAALFFTSLSMAATTDVVSNGSFETGLTGWSMASGTGTATGTCAVNSVTAPGTESLSSAGGFNAADGTKVALVGSQLTNGDSTGNSIHECVLYQDVSIPAGATTANFSADIGQKNFGSGVFAGQVRTRIGLYSTLNVPLLTSTPSVNLLRVP